MDGFSYFTAAFKTVELPKLAERINPLGAEGWELVTAVSTVKSLNFSGNDVVLIFKAAGVGRAPSEAAITSAFGPTQSGAW